MRILLGLLSGALLLAALWWSVADRSPAGGTDELESLPYRFTDVTQESGLGVFYQLNGGEAEKHRARREHEAFLQAPGLAPGKGHWFVHSRRSLRVFKVVLRVGSTAVARIQPLTPTIDLSARRATLRLRSRLRDAGRHVFTLDLYSHLRERHPETHVGWWRFALPEGEGETAIGFSEFVTN